MMDKVLAMGLVIDCFAFILVILVMLIRDIDTEDTVSSTIEVWTG